MANNGDGDNGTRVMFTGPPETMAESIRQTKARWEHEYGLAIGVDGAKISVDTAVKYGCPVQPGILQKRRD